MARILVATDDSRAFDVLQAELEGLGHEAVWAVTGHEAVSYAQEAPPDLVLIDSRIEMFDARETCYLMREDPDLPPALPILLLTDEEINAKKLEQFKVSGIIGRTHGSQDLREMLTRYGVS